MSFYQTRIFLNKANTMSKKGKEASSTMKILLGILILLLALIAMFIISGEIAMRLTGIDGAVFDHPRAMVIFWCIFGGMLIGSIYGISKWIIESSKEKEDRKLQEDQLHELKELNQKLKK
jgi:uncharacterized integral membrane protein